MGPENRFIKRVHDRLPKAIYHEKMHNVYRGGTPDVWYSGKRGDLWVEYKWAKNLKKPPALSELQKKWLRSRHAEGRPVAVVLAHPHGAAIYQWPHEWVDGKPSIVGNVDSVVFFLKARCA